MSSILRRVQHGARKLDISILRWSETNYDEPFILKVIDRLGVDVFVDVGANTGQTIDFLRTGSFAGQIVSFEPTPSLFGELSRRHGHDERWRGYQMALGSSRGILSLNEYADSSLNSVLRPSRFGELRFRSLAQAPVGRVDVPIETLNSVWSNLIPGGCTMLKIDTQGFDLEVLRGASDHLADVAALVVEVPVTQIYEGMSDMHTMFDYLRQHDFELAGLFPVKRHLDGLRLVEANCVFLPTLGQAVL